MSELSLIDSIAGLASIAHNEQMYPSDELGIPYIQYLAGVVDTLERWGVADEIVISSVYARFAFMNGALTEEEILNAAGRKGAEVMESIRCMNLGHGDWSSVPRGLVLAEAACRICHAKVLTRLGMAKSVGKFLNDSRSILDEASKINQDAADAVNDMRSLFGLEERRIRTHKITEQRLELN